MNGAFLIEGRTLVVDDDEGKRYRILPSSETTNPTAERESMTWRWEIDGTKYRLQLQITG